MKDATEMEAVTDGLLLNMILVYVWCMYYNSCIVFAHFFRQICLGVAFPPSPRRHALMA